VYEKLKENKIEIPNYFLTQTKGEFKQAIRELGFPKKTICFKPSNYTFSGGARGFRILRKNNSMGKIILKHKPDSPEIDLKTSMSIFDSYENPEILVMEYVPDYFMGSVYVLAKKGKMTYAVPSQSLVKKDGYAVEAIIPKNNVIVSLAKKITEIMNFDYNFHIQLRNSKGGKPKVIEINPRVAGGIEIAMAGGINLLYLSVKQALKEKLPTKKINYNTRMYRYWTELFETKKKSFDLSHKF